MLTMILVGLAGGLVTGVSPCVLPMIPVIFITGGSSADEGRVRPGYGRALAIIVGIVVSFSLITLLGTLVLAALGLPSGLLRWTGIVLLVLIGLGMLIPSVAHALERPFARLPGWTPNGKGGRFGPFLLGLGLGTLYVPCAGPVLAAISVAGATGDIGWRTVVLTVSFAIGAAIPLLVFAVAGASLTRRLAAYRDRQRTIRAVGGVILIGLAVALVFDAPARLQAAIPSYTASVDRALAQSDTVNRALGRSVGGAAACTGGGGLADCGPAPDLTGGGRWFNTPGDAPLTVTGLRGHVVLVDFWTYSCINCLRDGPHVRAWWNTYRGSGLEVVGVHTPEFAFEKDAGNVAAAIGDERISYPVVQDNDYAVWNAFGNRYWPAKYLIDAHGVIRAVSYGEGGYAEMEQRIRTLLHESAPDAALPAPTSGAADAPTAAGPISPEMYLSASRSAGAYSGGTLTAGTHDYSFAPDQQADTYALAGRFDVTDESVRAEDGARIRLDSTASSVNAVLGGNGRAVVHVDGLPDRVVDVSGPPRLHNLAAGDYRHRVVTLELSAGVDAYTFTFG
ncbi:cytochrome c biogenesis protein DipZ [Gordonia neofelifaecis]|uniref:Putative integral membrane c-type cytochrome biogenesis protein DipZ n=1 Tax=Gordonia neofelifaecis NRRL B-59395 TaxID=644548 RepID=F1YFY8_9ACTN|nr:cytochrome c biogenesis protein DipZ [Gordonia neofelifaecis]EGD56565.1 putative integral membrane c-type cytochrome biogenesis protein DipZ [Gordonia neofelifaecis NRRL B-59395]